MMIQKSTRNRKYSLKKNHLSIRGICLLGLFKYCQLSEEYKQDAVNRYYIVNKSIDLVANEFKIDVSTLTRGTSSTMANNSFVNHCGLGNSRSRWRKRNTAIEERAS